MTIKELLNNSKLPELEKEILLAFVLQKDKSYLHAHSDELINEQNEKKFQDLAKRRASGEPIQYLTNTAHFYGLNFYVDKRVLIPRQETEEMVDMALEFIKKSANKKLNIVDVGTGSGNIIIAITKNLPKDFAGKLFGIDVSPVALEVAQKNTTLHHLQEKISFLEGNLLEPLKEGVDLILANLPYVRTHLYGVLDPQITWEPKVAILGGDDGMQYYNQLFTQAQEKLNPTGLILYEIDGRIYEKKLL